MALDQIASAAEQVSEPSTGQIVRINGRQTFTLRWLLPRLRGFQCQHPGIETRVSTSTMSAQALGSRHDVIIRRGMMACEGYQCVQLLEDFAVPVCTPDLLKEHPIGQPADLLKYTLLVSETHPGSWEEWLSAAGLSKPKKVQRFEHFHVLLQAALEGFGVTLAPAVLAQEDIRLGRLVVALDQPRIKFVPFFVLYRTEGPNRQRIKIFVDWLMNEAANFAGR